MASSGGGGVAGGSLLRLALRPLRLCGLALRLARLGLGRRVHHRRRGRGGLADEHLGHARLVANDHDLVIQVGDQDAAAQLDGGVLPADGLRQLEGDDLLAHAPGAQRHQLRLVDKRLLLPDHLDLGGRLHVAAALDLQHLGAELRAEVLAKGAVDEGGQRVAQRETAVEEERQLARGRGEQAGRDRARVLHVPGAVQLQGVHRLLGGVQPLEHDDGLVHAAASRLALDLEDLLGQHLVLEEVHEPRLRVHHLGGGLGEGGAVEGDHARALAHLLLRSRGARDEAQQPHLLQGQGDQGHGRGGQGEGEEAAALPHDRRHVLCEGRLRVGVRGEL
mmetsp:Transcript_55319/g.120586  ORF Transcript_55319/g.120586 Transcript_55319/m.120586 type:complete len:334 (+) Transcript_55319:329-1330(+)